MKKEFSTAWVGSKQPRKQRKYILNAPVHIKRKFMSSTLSKDLRKKHSRRSIEIRKGDEVEVMRGKFDGKTGKVTLVNMKKMKIAIEGLQTSKRDGTKVNLWFHPSKVKITTLNMDDKMRIKAKTEIVKTENTIKSKAPKGVSSAHMGVSPDGQKEQKEK